jgi:hypothetical protein
MARWVAPTLSVEEIDKRIQELKAVQFWLDQNATALKASIQAMEVQKMTLSTLQSMNVNMADLAKAFTAKPPSTHSHSRDAGAPESATAPQVASASKTSLFTPKPAPQAAPDAAPQASPAFDQNAAGNAAPNHGPGADATAQSAVDPMQWWNALTQQFQAIASTALKDVATEAKRSDVAKPERKASGKAKAAATQGAKPGPVKRPVSKSVKSSATPKSAASTTSSKRAPRKAAPARSLNA